MIPTEIIQGDSLSWTESESNYPASNSWVIHYVLVNSSNRIEFNSIANGDGHDFDITTTTTSAWGSGEYTYQRYVTNNTDRITLDKGSVTIEKDFSTAQDKRSHAQKTLEAIEAVIENRASIDQQEYSINGRSLKRLTIDELFKFRDYYASKVRKEKGFSNKIWVRF